MTVSYKHYKIGNNNIEESSWINLIQYYRRCLRANAVYVPSVIRIHSSSNMNKIIFKSRHMAFLISRFIYNILNFQRISSHFLKIIRNIIKRNKIKKSIHLRIYNKNKELVFIKKIKHILLFFKWKYKKQFKYQRHILWKSFYNIPQSFWSASKKKKIKSFIWRFFNKTGKYFKKNRKTKYNFFFLNINRISNYIYKILNKKRIPKKKWFIIKKKNKKKKKINIKIINKLWYKFFNFNKIKEMSNYSNKKIHVSEIINESFFINSIINYLNPNKHFFLNNHSFFYFFMNYSYFQYFRSLKKYSKFIINRSIFLNLFYFFLSDTYKVKNRTNFIKTNILKAIIPFSTIPYHFFFIRLYNWFNIFSVDRDLCLYLITNKLVPTIKSCNFYYLYINTDNKKSIYLYNNYINNNTRNINNIFYIKFQNILLNKKKKIIIVNNRLKKHIKYYKNIYHSWVRNCFYPYIFNYKKILRLDLQNHSSNKVIKIKKIFNNKKWLFFNILKNKIKDIIINKNIKTFDNKTDNYIKNKMFRKFSYKFKNKKLKKKIKFLNTFKFSYNSLKNKDQFLLNYFLYAFIKKKIKNKRRKSINLKKSFNSMMRRNKYFFRNKKIKFNYFFIRSRNKKKQFTLKYKYFNNWKYYSIFKYIIIRNKFSNITVSPYSFNKLLRYKKIIKKRKNRYPKQIPLNVFISKNSYNYYLKNERFSFLNKLWENRKNSKINIFFNKKLNKKISFNEVTSRFLNKTKFINKFYYINSIEKELILEYYTRLHSNNIIDEYERNFSRIGPLAFYHSKTNNISNIKEGNNIISNIFIFSYFIYPKNFFSLTFNFTKVLISSFFSPFKKKYNIYDINQFGCYNKEYCIHYKQYLLIKK